jgi:peptidyl-tRNA hydrolase
MEPADYVLQDFRGGEIETAGLLLDEAVTVVQTYLSEGIDLAMTKHNLSK